MIRVTFEESKSIPEGLGFYQADTGLLAVYVRSPMNYCGSISTEGATYIDLTAENELVSMDISASREFWRISPDVGLPKIAKKGRVFFCTTGQVDDDEEILTNRDQNSVCLSFSKKDCGFVQVASDIFFGILEDGVLAQILIARIIEDPGCEESNAWLGLM